jgi:hypothetical protein
MRLFAASALALLAAPLASAQVTLNATMTADNLFTAYVSTSPTLEGTSFLSGANWPQTFQGSTVLTDAGTYYLHIIATDQGAPMMLIGLFTLDSTDATFANGTQSIVTDSVDWSVSDTGLGVGVVAPIDLGANGTSPWGNFALMGPEAHFIWHPNLPATAYFSTTITVVPAPAALVSFASLGLIAMRRRR